MNTSNEKHKYLWRAIAIVMLVICLSAAISFMQRYLCITDSTDQTRLIAFHAEPEDSIDVLFIGSSPTYSGFSSAYAYEKFGFTSYPYAIGGASCTMWKPALQDALRTQHPKLVVIDMFGGGYDIDTMLDRPKSLYMIMNSIPMSVEKIKMASEISSTVENVDTLSLLFPIIRYHSNIPGRVRTLRHRLETERYVPSPMKGIEYFTGTRKLAKVDEQSFTNDTEALDPRAEKVIRGFMEYCRGEDINVLFVKYPFVLTEQDPDELIVNRRMNSIMKLADEYDYPTLNLQKDFHKIGLKERKDFYNHGHTNHRGQKKVTDYLGSYITKEMGIGPTELDDTCRQEWDRAAKYYDNLCDISEELTLNRERELIADSPELVRMVEDYMESHQK